MAILRKLQDLFAKGRGQQQEKSTTAIPPEIRQLIPQVRQQYPQLAHLPDEVVAQVILQAIQEQQVEPLAGRQGLEEVSAGQLRYFGKQLLDTGRWEEAE
ncbi:MAG: hypothetical protein H8D43_04605, partial [Chloroflexi bacterium]|nr:hypothetical protein [Chloroflexota bacterium]